MARIGGVAGAFVSPTPISIDFTSHEITWGQECATDTSYGDTAESNAGNGLPNYRVTATGFAKTPGDPQFSMTGTTLSAGGNLTATYQTSHTFAIKGILSEAMLSNARRSPTTPARYSFVGTGACTQTWTTT